MNIDIDDVLNQKGASPTSTAAKYWNQKNEAS